ncbi:hypothetical protein PXO_05476 [Xanthomonas oryzae pv. oryzae PXO99A]|uniref:Uncharacterized protein n=1 Tax=Xanthomonas oryzae pv. oryzae (strain PXO99A) TaxID=360094 RepID=A0A0K0GHC8_XANOP|nr:hypothetical protein PXO_05476 [Xanthomonas oryzae pv. oryzae PXO99A]
MQATFAQVLLWHCQWRFRRQRGLTGIEGRNGGDRSWCRGKSHGAIHQGCQSREGDSAG